MFENHQTENQHEKPDQGIQHRLRIGWAISIVGLAVFLVGAKPAIFGLDRSPMIGFIQISVFLIGLGILCLSGVFCYRAVWYRSPRSLAVDIGMRMVATGFILAFFTGMADVLGLGSHRVPTLPYFGPLQELGVMIGESVIGFGFVLMIPLNSAEEQPDSDYTSPNN